MVTLREAQFAVDHWRRCGSDPAAVNALLLVIATDAALVSVTNIGRVLSAHLLRHTAAARRVIRAMGTKHWPALRLHLLAHDHTHRDVARTLAGGVADALLPGPSAPLAGAPPASLVAAAAALARAMLAAADGESHGAR